VLELTHEPQRVLLQVLEAGVRRLDRHPVDGDVRFAATVLVSEPNDPGELEGAELAERSCLVERGVFGPA
jgi:hypothetical protein